MVFYDILKALSAALGREKTNKNLTEPSNSSSIENSMEEVAYYLNEKLHDQAKMLITEFKKIR